MGMNYLIIGKRATGKTTLANKLLNGVPNSVVLEYEGQDFVFPETRIL
jgi:type IV secretory pathway ATPase VirB11/archaellum biosynthesis ATPase